MGAVVAVFFAFFDFAAFDFFVFVLVVVSCAPVAAANTGIASENAITNVNNITKSFFMLGLDLLMIFLRSFGEQGMGHFSSIALDIAK